MYWCAFYSREGGMAVAATADFSIIIMDATTLRASCSDRWLLWLDLTMMFRSCILLRKHTAFLSRLSPSALIDYYLQQDLPTIVVVSSHFHNNFLAVRSPIHPNQETWHFNWWNDIVIGAAAVIHPLKTVLLAVIVAMLLVAILRLFDSYYTDNLAVFNESSTD